jgi:hypothetical protein
VFAFYYFSATTLDCGTNLCALYVRTWNCTLALVVVSAVSGLGIVGGEWELESLEMVSSAVELGLDQSRLPCRNTENHNLH